MLGTDIQTYNPSSPLRGSSHKKARQLLIGAIQRLLHSVSSVKTHIMIILDEAEDEKPLGMR